jgi:hypothetical protein
MYMNGRDTFGKENCGAVTPPVVSAVGSRGTPGSEGEKGLDDASTEGIALVEVSGRYGGRRGLGRAVKKTVAEEKG